MKLSQGQYNLVNAIVLNIVWICAVAGAAAGQAWFGPAAMAIFVFGHLPFADRHDLRLVAILTPLGFVVDSIYAASGMISYASPWPSDTFAPAWILALWIAFALTLRHSLRWMTERPVLGAILGGIFGPVSYWFAGNVWGAATFNWSLPAWFSVIAATWAGVMLLSYWLLRLETRAEARQPAAAAA